MTSDNQPSEITYSDHCQDVMVDGHRFSIKIFSLDQHAKWHLKVIDEHGKSHVWTAPFDSDTEALEAARIAFEDEGADGFLQPQSNIVPFQRGSGKSTDGG